MCVQYIYGISPLSGFTYPKIDDQDNRSHKAGYQVTVLTKGLPCAFTRNVWHWQTSDQSQNRRFRNLVTLLPQKIIPLSDTYTLDMLSNCIKNLYHKNIPVKCITVFKNDEKTLYLIW